MSTGEMEQNLRKAGMEMAIEVLAHNRRNRVLGEWQSQAQEMAGIGKKHLYVLFFDTAPEWQGHGCGSALLRFLGDVADVDGVVTFLETAGTRNTSFYSNKGGYEEVFRSPVATFDFEGGGVAMQRVPRSSVVHGVAMPVSPTFPPSSRNSNADNSKCESNICGHKFLPKRQTGPLANRCQGSLYRRVGS